MEKIHIGYILDATESEQASQRSYENMTEVGIIRIGPRPEPQSGDDLNDTPYNCNGSIYEGGVFLLY